jgi:hypothetical protein
MRGIASFALLLYVGHSTSSVDGVRRIDRRPTLSGLFH